MEQSNNKVSYNKVAAILFTVYAAFQVFYTIRGFVYGSFPWVAILVLGACVISAYALYSERKDYLLLIGFGILLFSAIYSFLIGFRYQNYYVFNWRYGMRFNLFAMLPALLNLFSKLSAFGLVFVFATEYLPQGKEYAKKFWFAPAVCEVGSFVVAILIVIITRISGKHWGGTYSYFSFGSIVLRFIVAAAFLLVALWLAYPEGFSKKEAMAGETENTGATVTGTSKTNTVVSDSAYCSLVTHILLLLFTCGVWLYIWIYRITGYTNQAKGEEYRNPTTKLLLCMFVPFYSIYWTYKSAIRIDKMSQEKGISSDLATLCLILAIFVPIIPPILMQDKVNAIVSSSAPVQPTANVQAAQYVQPTPVQSQPVQSVVDETELLKKYKDLLDTGVITQEEFDAKKKQILGL